MNPTNSNWGGTLNRVRGLGQAVSKPVSEAPMTPTCSAGGTLKSGGDGRNSVPDSLETSEFEFIRALMRSQAGIVIDPRRKYLVESQLVGLIRREGIASLQSLVGGMRANPGDSIEHKVIDVLSPDETAFFRDPWHFDLLRTVILPAAIEAGRPERVLNLWCAATSTGQEAYSLLMLVQEHFPELLEWKLRLLATDLSFESLERARTGRYSLLEINRGLPACLLVKHFMRQGIEWEIAETLRHRVEFQRLNLVSEWGGLPLMGVVLLCNVLAHVDVTTEHKLLVRIRRFMRPGGMLLLGANEVLRDSSDDFEPVTMNGTTYYRYRSTEPLGSA